jgi:hypothetical protein
MSQVVRRVTRTAGLIAAAGLLMLLTAADPARLTWTMDLDKMKVPDAPVTGKLLGADFKGDVVKLDKLGALTLQQGKDVIPDAAVIIFLPIKPGQTIAGKAFAFGPKDEDAHRPSIHIERKPAPNRLPQMTAVTHDYALRLQFGPEKDGKVPGGIYLCLPGETKDVVAGTFTVPLR